MVRNDHGTRERCAFLRCASHYGCAGGERTLVHRKCGPFSRNEMCRFFGTECTPAIWDAPRRKDVEWHTCVCVCAFGCTQCTAKHTHAHTPMINVTNSDRNPPVTAQLTACCKRERSARDMTLELSVWRSAAQRASPPRPHPQCVGVK